jgi:hypothetical protein
MSKLPRLLLFRAIALYAALLGAFWLIQRAQFASLELTEFREFVIKESIKSLIAVVALPMMESIRSLFASWRESRDWMKFASRSIEAEQASLTHLASFLSDARWSSNSFALDSGDEARDEPRHAALLQVRALLLALDQAAQRLSPGANRELALVRGKARSFANSVDHLITNGVDRQQSLHRKTLDDFMSAFRILPTKVGAL